MQPKLNLELVKAAALLKGLNLTEVAARVGVSVESVSKWWHGEATPRPGKARLLGEVLGLSFDRLYAGPLESNPVGRSARLAPGQDLAADTLAERERLFGQLFEKAGRRRAATSNRGSSDGSFGAISSLSQALRKQWHADPQGGPISLRRLAEWFSLRQWATLVPVFWGNEGAAAETAPAIIDSTRGCAWLPLNLDLPESALRERLCLETARFMAGDWLQGQHRDDYIRRLACAMLVPARVGLALAATLSKARTPALRETALVRVARELGTTPDMALRRAVECAQARSPDSATWDTPELRNRLALLPPDPGSFADSVFPAGPPSVEELVDFTGHQLASPFFYHFLADYLQRRPNDWVFVQQLLDCPMADALAIARCRTWAPRSRSRTRLPGQAWGGSPA